MPNVIGPRGAPSVVTGTAVAPVSCSAHLAGSLMVAEARMNCRDG
jgi:hypothetical protein